MKADAEFMRVQLNEPAFRQPTEVEVSPTADRILVKVSRSAKIRLAYRQLGGGEGKPILKRRESSQLGAVVKDDVVWDTEGVEWLAIPGQYEIGRVAKGWTAAASQGQAIV